MALSDYLDATCSISRPSYTRDAQGGRVDTPTSVATGLPCRLRNLSGRELEYLGKDTNESWYRMYVDGNSVTINQLDIVTVATGDNVTGTYEVRRKNTPRRFVLQHHYELDVVKYNG